MRLFLVRHCESQGNAERRMTGQSDPPLSPHGLEQARALAEALRPAPLAAVHCSTLARARTTAVHISAPHNLFPRSDPAWCELHFGTWQGQSRAVCRLDPSYQAWRTNPLGVRPPHGETLGDVRDRVAPALAALLARHAGAPVVLVTHSLAARVMLCHLLGTTLDLVPRLRLPTASISVVRLESRRTILERLADVSHLGALRMQQSSTGG